MAPKIKLYLLPANYTQASDDDVKEIFDDELLPCIPKQEALNSVMPLTGVIPYNVAACFPINWAAGQTTDQLSPSGTINQYLAHNSPATVLMGVAGAYAVQVADPSGNLVNPTGYVVVANAGNATLFDHINFPGGAPAGLMTIRYWQKGTTPTQYFALPADNPYTGPNTAISTVLAMPSGTGNSSYEGLNRISNTNLIGATNGVVQFPVTATNLWVTYYAKNTKAAWFAGDHPNWIADHMRMWPDIFVGTEDYPGDDGSINGTPVVQGTVGQFQAIGTYSIDYRDGIVRFPAAIDSSATIVQANYAYLIGIRNVTGQALDPVDRQLTTWVEPSASGIYVNLNVTDANAHQVSLYCIDYDNQGRNQKIDIINTSGTVLATHTVSAFSGGIISKFKVNSGFNRVRITSQNSFTPVLSACFLDPTAAGATAFIADDTATQGSWKGTYGNDGWLIAGDSVKAASYVTPSPSGTGLTTNTWISLTYTDVHATQRAHPLAWQAISETMFPQSHGRPWVNRNTTWLPRNVYDTGKVTGNPQTVVPYDTLTVKMS